MTVNLMVTCMCDAIFGDVAICSTRVLEAVGCEVKFDPMQSCCGQPPFNAGDWHAATLIASHTRKVFHMATEASPIVTPSSSCAAMMRHGYEMLAGQPLVCYELAEFLVRHMGIQTWPPKGDMSLEYRMAFHRACHGRMLGFCSEAELLLGSIPGVSLVEFDDPEQCCGFGGAFSIGHGKVSEGVGLAKLRAIADSGAEVIVSADMGCLAHLQGLIDRHRFPLQTRHLAQVLAEALG